MRGYYRNGISCGANRREVEDQGVMKGKLKIKKGIRPSWSLILEEASTRRRREEKRRGRRRRRRRKGKVSILVWIAMILYRIVCMGISLFHF